jgi:hypothetical protein
VKNENSFLHFRTIDEIKIPGAFLNIPDALKSVKAPS